MKFDFLDLGFVDYASAYQLQKKIWQATFDRDSEGVVILAEHNSVYTRGRSFNESSMLKDKDFLNRQGAQIYDIERGGDVTYHGPGQIVLYPVLNLKFHKKDLRAYVYDLEEAVIKFLQHLGIKGFRNQLQRGVWTESGKISSLGVAIRRWIAFHGVSINVNPEKKYFNYIKPCGLEAGDITSLFDIMGPEIFQHQLKPILRNSFSQVFN
jgi:lipoate-protein ligase B